MAVAVATALADTVSAREVLVTGIAMALVITGFALVFGLVAWLVRLVARRRRPVRAMLASPLPWGAAAVLMCLTVAGDPRVARIDRPLSAEQRSIVGYYNGTVVCHDRANVDLDIEQDMVDAIEAADWEAAAGHARRMLSGLRRLHACIRDRIPGDDHELRPEAARYAGGLEKHVLAYETYVRLIEEGGERGLGLADRRLEQGEDEAEAALRGIERIYRSREPRDMDEHVDWEYMRRVFEEKALTRPPTA